MCEESDLVMEQIPHIHDGSGLLLPLRHLNGDLHPVGHAPLRRQAVLGRVHDLLRLHIRVHFGRHRFILPEFEG